MVILILGGPAACADVDPGGDPIEWSRTISRGVGQILRNDPPPAPRVDATPPPDEGRPYPNLASVPPKPPLVMPRVRDAEIAVLDRDRAAAEGRAEAIRQGGPDPGPDPHAGERLGVVTPGAGGEFSATDDQLLRRVVKQAGQDGARIRLQGDTAAALTTADRLTRLGMARERIEVQPATRQLETAREVEIRVASGKRER